jgi:hypothetical protein
VAILTFCSLPVLGNSLEPLTVSPGATDRVTGVEVRCPTFSWQAVPGAAGYEVVVYELPPEVDLAAWSLDEAVEVLFVELPVGVTAWTPSFENGLVRGAEHVWFVRGVMGGEDATEWSEARFFRVAGADEGSVTRGRVGDSGAGSGTGSGSTATATVPVSATDAATAPASDTAAKAPPKSRQGYTAAIQGENTDPSGFAYGVVGFSSSPDGAGLAGVNTGGGPDLVLDGAADGLSDAHIYQDRIEVSSAGPRMFSIANTGGGGLTLDVDGAGVLTTASTIDADTLDGIDSTGFSPSAHVHDVGVPSGAVMFFNLASCPTGWSALAAAEGRAVVGLPASGTLAGTHGMQLTDLQPRTIADLPAHVHSVDPANQSVTLVSESSHTHTTNPGSFFTSASEGIHGHTNTSSDGDHDHFLTMRNGGISSGYLQGADPGGASYSSRTPISTDGDHTHSVSPDGSSHMHQIDVPSTATSSNSGHSHSASFNMSPFDSESTGVAAVDVTMPYIQLLVCVKD